MKWLKQFFTSNDNKELDSLTKEWNEQVDPLFEMLITTFGDEGWLNERGEHDVTSFGNSCVDKIMTLTIRLVVVDKQNAGTYVARAAAKLVALAGRLNSKKECIAKIEEGMSVLEVLKNGSDSSAVRQNNENKMEMFEPPISENVFGIWKADGEALGLDSSQLNAIAFLMGFFSGWYEDQKEFDETVPFCEVDYDDPADTYGNINDGPLKEILAKAALTINPEIEFRNLSRFENEPIYSWVTGDQPDFPFNKPNLSGMEVFYQELIDRLAKELDMSGYDEKNCYGSGVFIFSMQHHIDAAGTIQLASTLKALPPSYLGYLINLPKGFQKVTSDFYKLPVFSKVLRTFIGSGRLQERTWHIHNLQFFKSEKGSYDYLDNWTDTPQNMWVRDILQAVSMVWTGDKSELVKELKNLNEYKDYPYVEASLTWDMFQNVLWEIMETKYGFSRRVPYFEPAKYDYNAAFYNEAVKLRMVSYVPEIDSQLSSM